MCPWFDCGLLGGENFLKGCSSVHISDGRGSEKTFAIALMLLGLPALLRSDLASDDLRTLLVLVVIHAWVRHCLTITFRASAVTIKVKRLVICLSSLVI